ncbi:oligoribonuclease [Thermodesulfobacteriota bacterium]
MENNLIWIDLEMTGLDPEQRVIIEIASIVTDDQLNIIAEGPNIAINYPEAILTSMEEWSMAHHTESGLVDRARNSSYNCRSAEKETLNFLRSYCKEGTSPLCGNSIWQDRRFLIKHMPEIERFCHYRIIDVSTIKEMASRWYPLLPPYEKEKAHLAKSDIIESIKEMIYYRENVFRD